MSRFRDVAYRPPFRTATPYVAASGRDAGRAMPGTIGLLAYLIEQAIAIAIEFGYDPATLRIRSGGIYNPRRTASGIWSVHRDGRALDLMVAVSVAGHRVMVELLRRIGPNAWRVGITYAIFSRSQTRAGGWVAYGIRGDRLHDHDDHLHAEQAPEFARLPAATMVATCRRVLGDWRRPTDGEDEQMAAYVESRQRILRELKIGDDAGALLEVDGVAGPKTEQAERRYAIEVLDAARRFAAFVAGLQEALNAGRHRDGSGRALEVDGRLGPRTLEALTAALTQRGSAGLTSAQARSLFDELLGSTRLTRGG